MKSSRKRYVRTSSAKAVAVTLMLASAATSAQASVFLPATGSATWNATASWDNSTIPNASGANATFNGAASGSVPAQTGNRTATLDGAQTVGSILFNDD